MEVAENLLGTTDLDAEVRGRRSSRRPRATHSSSSRCSRCSSTTGSSERDDRGRWILIRDVGAITVPPTIQALLSARLDRLGPIDRVVVERGRRDRPGVLPGSRRGPLAGRGSPPRRREPSEPHPRELVAAARVDASPARRRYRFMHILIREAAYHGLLKRTRADLHVRFIDWLERVASDRGPRVRGDPRLPPRAGLLHAPAAHAERRAGLADRRPREPATSPPPDAARSRAATSRRPRTCSDGRPRCCPPGHPERPRLRLDAAEALTEQGGFDEASAMLDDCDRRGARALGPCAGGDRAGSRSSSSSTRSIRRRWSRRSSPASRSISPSSRLLEAHDGLARAWRLIMFVREMGLQWGDPRRRPSALSSTRRLAGNRLMVDAGDPLARLLRARRPDARARGDRALPRRSSRR